MTAAMLLANRMGRVGVTASSSPRRYSTKSHQRGQRKRVFAKNALKN